MNRTRKKIVRPKNPYASANIFSRWSFWWMKSVFRGSLKRPLEDEDLYETHKSLDSERITNKFSILWENECKRKHPSIVRLVVRAYGALFIPLGTIYAVFDSTSKSIQPLLLGKFVSYFVAGQTSISATNAHWYALGIVLCAVAPIIVFHPVLFCIFQVGTKIRLGLSGLIYRKCLRSSISVSNDGIRERAINILSNDLNRFDVTLGFMHEIWKGPIEALIIAYIVYREIGIAAVVGVAFMFTFIPLQGWAARMAAHFRKKTAERTDVRVKFMNEIIQGIQVIKMYAWENSFAKIIANVRMKEVSALRGTSYIYASLNCSSMISPLSIFLALVSYIYLGDALTSQRVYTVSSYFNMLNDSMIRFWSLAMSFMAESMISVRRCKEFLLDGEEVPRNVDGSDNVTEKVDTNEFTGTYKRINDAMESISDTKAESQLKEYNPTSEDKYVILEHVTANWKSKSSNSDPTLADLNVQIQNKTLAVVVGPVGAGKSTFLNILLGELPINSGHMKVNGKISYAAQEPWVFEGTVRDNIVFVDDYDERRYKRVIAACALQRDLELLPRSDLTLVGERGVSLSGGQKARINLARAVYHKADIYLLDDPLSAVDTHVGKLIFHRCIRDFLSDKICILVTHQLQYLFNVKHLILINSGRIEAQGSYKMLQRSKKFQFLEQTHGDVVVDTVSVCSRSSRKDSQKSFDQDHNSLHVEELPVEDLNKETQAVGSVKWNVYISYFKALQNSFILTLIIGLFICTRVMLSGVDYFLSRWVNWEERLTYNRMSPGNNSELGMSSNITHQSEYSSGNDETVEAFRKQLIMFYGILLGATFVVYLSRTFGFFGMCLRISLRLHDRLFRGITRAPIYFFNTNSSGRILNRFSKDIRTADTDLPQTMADFVSFIIDITGVIVIVAIANYFLLIPAGVIVVCLFFMRYVYVCTSRSAKRLDSISRSPVYSLTNQTFQGLTTIRALKAEFSLDKEFHAYQDANTSAWFLFIASSRAFALWTDIICVIYIAVVTFSFLLFDTGFTSGDVGLAILHSTTLTKMCQWGMRQSAQLENHMTSVERILEYTKLTSEPPLETLEKFKPPGEWPDKGRIEFNNLKMKYSAKGAYVLKGLTFTIEPLEKVGIVGRTGAGKSSIMQAVFRLACNEGSICIDGINIETLGLHDLRSKISIIPQDPVLFSGTLRYNLDPMAECTDTDMWNALNGVELRQYVSSQIGGLDCRVYDGGLNFSVGQRQLVCLARAILRKNKILVLDEATANVDPETDKLIQKTIRTQFADCTVLTIAHRLHTVMDSDRVLVMDAGHAVELGHAYELLNVNGGYLRQLVDHTGTVTASLLYELAEQSYKRKLSESGIELHDSVGSDLNSKE